MGEALPLRLTDSRFLCSTSYSNYPECVKSVLTDSESVCSISVPDVATNIGNRSDSTGDSARTTERRRAIDTPSNVCQYRCDRYRGLSAEVDTNM
jgi:hypothetical protein